MTRQELSEAYFTLRTKKDDLNKELKVVQEELDQMEERLVMAMQNESLTLFKDERYGTVYLREELYAGVEEADVCYRWFRDNGMGDIIKETIHSKTLSAIAKERDDIPGIRKHLKTKVGIRRS